MSLIIFFLVLSVLVGVHEFGHLVVAKMTNTYVKSFSLGFGPVLLKKKIGETEYRISALPLGGYVGLAGESGKEEDKSIPKEKYLTNKKPWQKLLVVLAGPFMNIALAFVLMPMIFILGVPDYSKFNPNSTPVDEVHVGQIIPGSSAQKYGIKTGDVILGFKEYKPNNYSNLTDYIANNPDKKVTAIIKRKDKIIDIELVIGRSLTNPNEGALGVSFYFDNMPVVKSNPIDAVSKGTSVTVDSISAMGTGIKKMVDGSIPTKDAVGGPIQIAALTGSAYNMGIQDLLFFMALLSLNLAILNMLPILPLDGGHALFYSLEIIGIKIPTVVKNIFATIGVILLLSLMLFATVFDIARYKNSIVTFFSKLF